MRIGTFLGIIEQSAGVAREQAERAIEATLRTLAEREHVDRDTAYDHVRAVLAGLAQAVAPVSSGTWRRSSRRIINPC